jgi:hypothetical protein
MADLQTRQQQSAERWMARRQQGPQSGRGTGPAHTPSHKHEPKPELRREKNIPIFSELFGLQVRFASD